MTEEGNGKGSDWGKGGSRETNPKALPKNAVPEDAGEDAVICLCYQCGFRMLEDPGCLCRKNVCRGAAGIWHGIRKGGRDMCGITAQVSIYPLGEADLSPAIDAAVGAFHRHGVEHKTGEMSTVLWGDDEKLFDALRDAFRVAASRGPAVMTVTVSNACPWPGVKSAG